jgi:hypothetical protein
MEEMAVAKQKNGWFGTECEKELGMFNCLVSCYLDIHEDAEQKS